MLSCNYISLDGLTLLPSKDYSASLSGIFNFNQDIVESNLYYDGSYFGYSKVSSRDLTLSVIVKHQFDNSEILSEQRLNYILKQKNIKLQFMFEDDDSLYECVVNCYSRAVNTGDETIVCTLHLSDPNIYKSKETKTLGKTKTGGFYFTSSGFTISANGFEFDEGYYGNTIEVFNNGDTVYPLITVKGDANNIKISNLSTNETLYINYPIKAEDELTIDCNPSTRKIRLNGSIPLMKYKQGSYLTLANGSNLISVDYAGNCSVEFSYREVL